MMVGYMEIKRPSPSKGRRQRRTAIAPTKSLRRLNLKFVVLPHGCNINAVDEVKNASKVSHKNPTTHGDHINNHTLRIVSS